MLKDEETALVGNSIQFNPISLRHRVISALAVLPGPRVHSEPSRDTSSSGVGVVWFWRIQGDELRRREFVGRARDVSEAVDVQ